jgi:hypothetical protein
MKLLTSRRAGFTLVELLTAALITTVILGSVAAASIALQKSFLGNRVYTKAAADSSRLVDYISQDLRNAMAVSRRTAGVPTAFKVGNFEITENDQLCVFVPDYYTSNIPDNASGSAYKTPRFSRNNIPTGRTYYNYDFIVKIDGITRIPNYPSTLEVRYVKRARGGGDPTVCFFRLEYEGGTLRKTEEIAERAEGERIRVVATEPKIFQITTSFNSYWSGEKYRDASRQFSTVYLQNYRTDLR